MCLRRYLDAPWNAASFPPPLAYADPPSTTLHEHARLLFSIQHFYVPQIIIFLYCPVVERPYLNRLMPSKRKWRLRYPQVWEQKLRRGVVEEIAVLSTILSLIQTSWCLRYQQAWQPKLWRGRQAAKKHSAPCVVISCPLFLRCFEFQLLVVPPENDGLLSPQLRTPALVRIISLAAH